MRLTCMTSPMNRACRFEETNSLKAWCDYSFTLVSDRLRDFDGCSAELAVTSLDQQTSYATCVLREDPLAQHRDRRYGTLLLSGPNVTKAYEDVLAGSGVGTGFIGPVKSTFRLTIVVHPSRTVLVDTDVPVVLCAGPGKELS